MDLPAWLIDYLTAYDEEEGRQWAEQQAPEPEPEDELSAVPGVTPGPETWIFEV